MLTNRQLLILQLIIHYIRKLWSRSVKEVDGSCRITFSSAGTIRNEMMKLEEMGWPP